MGQILGQNFLLGGTFFNCDLVGQILAIFSVRIFFLHFGLEFDTLAVRKKDRKRDILYAKVFGRCI